MKTKLILLIFCCAMILCSCQTSSILLNPYSQVELLQSSDVLTNVEPQFSHGFASNLSVIDLETAHSGNIITASSALLVSTDTNEALYYKDVYKQIAPASLTKLMTALMVLKYGNLNDTITFTPEMLAVNNPEAQMCGFVAGDSILVKDLFNCMLVYSGNDTSNALGMYISGTIEDFAKLMNEEAKLLGATHTNFVNACGLDENGHMTCTYDLYLMFAECMKYPEFMDAIKLSNVTATYTNSLGETKSKSFPSTNLYFTGTYEIPDGIQMYGGKTGTTGNAGTCLILYSEDELNKGYISVVMGSPNKPELYQQMTNLLSIIQKN